MIIALVQIPYKAGRPHQEAWLKQAIESTKIYRDVKGLIRKDYIRGEDHGGGIYHFESRAEAEAWFNAGWADWMEGRFGTRPSLTIYENLLTLDNEAGEIRVDGKPQPLPEAAE